MNPTTVLRRIDDTIARVRAALADLEGLRSEAFDDAQEAAGLPLAVVAAVARRLGSSAADVLGRSQVKGATRARCAVCVALSRCGQGPSAIGYLLGRDHSSVIAAVAKGAKRMEERGFRLAVELGVAVWNGHAEAAEPELAAPEMQRLTFGHGPDCRCPTCAAGRVDELAVGT